MRYASDTEVSVEKSRSEIEGTLRRYGATGFLSGWEGSQAMIAFKVDNWEGASKTPEQGLNEGRGKYLH